jgi:hypothetical protein
MRDKINCFIELCRSKIKLFYINASFYMINSLAIIFTLCYKIYFISDYKIKS